MAATTKTARRPRDSEDDSFTLRHGSMGQQGSVCSRWPREAELTLTGIKQSYGPATAACPHGSCSRFPHADGRWDSSLQPARFENDS